ncbi:hypothetical protein K466DRAFT_98847 [Polyporus arcularius HHB13444]|uniref:Uncharacterized protein n=1 Tax=Polyporus arcularius HHB13444 TaxID=1314778 RepID=A0A5C3PGN9_9APHY|nr:hypothetical protein K466DRAFT_98847 [Polyporus arcularius HHB13444]
MMIDLLARVTISEHDLMVLATVLGLLASIGALTVFYLAYHLAHFVSGVLDNMVISVSPVLFRIQVGRHGLEFTDAMLWSALGNAGTLYLLDRPIVLDVIAYTCVLLHIFQLVRSCIGLCAQLCPLVNLVCCKTLSTAFKVSKTVAKVTRSIAYTTGSALVLCLSVVLRWTVFAALVCLTGAVEITAIYATTILIDDLVTLVLANRYVFLEVLTASYTHQTAIVSFALKTIPQLLDLVVLCIASHGLFLVARQLNKLWHQGYDVEHFGNWLASNTIAGCERTDLAFIALFDHVYAAAVAVVRFFLPDHFADDTSVDWLVNLSPIPAGASNPEPAASNPELATSSRPSPATPATILLKSSTSPCVVEEVCDVLPGNKEVETEVEAVEIEVLDRDSDDNSEPTDAPSSPPIVWRYCAWNDKDECVESLPYYHVVDEATGKDHFEPVPGFDHPVYSTIDGRNLTYSDGGLYVEMGELHREGWLNGLWRPIVLFVLAFDTARIEEVQDSELPAP